MVVSEFRVTVPGNRAMLPFPKNNYASLVTTGGAGVGAVPSVGVLVSLEIARLRESVATGVAGVGAIAGMGALVSRQAVGVPARLAAESALEHELVAHPNPPLLAQSSRALVLSFSGVRLPSPLASAYRRTTAHR